MEIVVKVVVTPVLVTVATLLARRFGQSVAGWLVGFPLTSAPISFFLALDHGVSFAAAAAVGSIASVMAQATFAVAYAHARSRGWVLAVTGGGVAFAAVAYALRLVLAPAPLMASAAWTVLAAGMWLIPPPMRSQLRVTPPPWDLPARIVVTTALVIAITTFAPVLGPFTSGVVSGFPLYALVLGVFAHRSVGADAAAEVMRGLVGGLFGFATYFLVIASTIEPLGLGIGTALAVASVLAVQAASFVLLRRDHRTT